MNVTVPDSLNDTQAPTLVLPGKLTVYFDHGRSECELDQVAAQTAFGSKIWENDLKIVEGIGEKIETILKKQGNCHLAETFGDTWR